MKVIADLRLLWNMTDHLGVWFVHIGLLNAKCQESLQYARNRVLPVMCSNEDEMCQY